MGLQYIGNDKIINLLGHLVSIPSVNLSLDSKNGSGEKAIAEFCVKWLSEYGIKSWFEEVAKDRANAVAEVGNGSGPTLILCAHLDTVGVNGMAISPFEPKIENGKLLGRGSYDMKAGVASIMATAVELANLKFNGKLMLALVCDEEHSSIGAQDFVNKYKADACILTEPSEEEIITAHKGFVWFEIKTKGTAAHGSRWDLGQSAISSMAKTINALTEFDESVLRKRNHPLVGSASLHCSLIDGGSAESVYAAECKMIVERRTLPNENINDVVGEIKSLVGEIDPNTEVSIRLKRSPAVCADDEKILRCMHNAYEKIMGKETKNTGVQYWMDMAFFVDAGIPTVNIGVIGEGAHADVEWVDTNSLIRSTEILVETAKVFFKK